MGATPPSQGLQWRSVKSQTVFIVDSLVLCVGASHVMGATHAVGAGHAREQKGAGIGAFLVPERKVARMAALCPRVLLHSCGFLWWEGGGVHTQASCLFNMAQQIGLCQVEQLVEAFYHEVYGLVDVDAVGRT